MSAQAARKPPREGGYALLIMLVIMVTGGLYALTNRLDSAQQKSTQANNTQQALTQAREALLAYAALYPDYHSDESFGFLPCPDIDGDGDADASSSSCQQNVGETVIGLFPYKTLGLPALRDSDGNCLWYAVSGRFKASTMNKSENLNWDTQGQIVIRDISNSRDILKPEDAQGGAAAVIFSPGPPIGAQSRPAGDSGKPCSVIVGATTHTQFIESGVFPAALGISPTIIQGIAGHAAYNDELATITPLEIFVAAKRRKGSNDSDFVGRNHELGKQIANALTPTETLPAITSATATGKLEHGPVPDLALKGSASADFKHWRSQYRYVKCKDNSRCINTSTDACTGILLFGGERAEGGPRTLVEAGTLASFYEGGNLDGVANGSTAFSSTYGTTGLSSAGTLVRPSLFAITDATLAAAGDDAVCLKPRETNLQDFNSFTNVQPSSTPTIRTTDTTGTATGTSKLYLGSTSSALLYGCSWYGNRLPVSAGLRIYFRFSILDRGAGFTFALADGITNPSPTMCGASGGSLGYSGDNGVTPVIEAPKLALEFDTRGNSTSFNDPSGNHAAFVFWAGTSRSDDIDNKHDTSCNANVTNSPPCNPRTAPGLVTLSELDIYHTGPTGIPTDTYVRIDIIPQPVPSPAPSPLPTPTYILRAYVTQNNFVTTACKLADLSMDINAITCQPTLSSTLQTGMSSAYVGFTVGQSTGTSGPQSIVIDSFKLRER